MTTDRATYDDLFDASAAAQGTADATGVSHHVRKERATGRLVVQRSTPVDGSRFLTVGGPAEPAMSDAEQFFYDHAGWSYDAPNGEASEQGRRRMASTLAHAEREMQSRGWHAIVADGPDVMEDDADSVELVASGEMVNLEVVLLSDDHTPCAHNVLGSLCSIVVASPADPYIRVVTAELAAEALRDAR